MPQVAEVRLLQYHDGPDDDVVLERPVLDVLDFPADGDELDDVLVPAQVVVAQSHNLGADLAERVVLGRRGPAV